MNEDEKWVELPTQEAPTETTPVETPQEKPEGSEAGPRAQKRIKQLVGKTKDLEAETQRLRQELEAARREAAEKIRGTESSANAVYKSSLQEKLKAAESKWQSAYDAADKDTLVAAQNDMIETRLELKALEVWERNNQQPPQQPQPQPQPRTPQIAPATKDWMDSNPWFGRGPKADKAATSLAVSISDDLVEEGFDPASQEFYQEVEKRLVAEMPRMASKIRGAEETVPVVVGQSRSPNRRIRLDEATVKASQKLGATLEDTAKYAEAIQNAGDGYVNIDIKRGRK